MATVPASLVAPFPLTTALVPPSPTTLDKLAGMSALAIPLPVTAALVPPSPATLDKLAQAQEIILARPQVTAATEHLFHGGMYARTMRLIPGVWMIGSLIRLATVLIVHGDCAVIVGDEQVELSGYNVIPGCAGRKQLFWTRGPVEMTMIFPTHAQTVTEAEDEVFAEAEQLQSRKDSSRNTVMITGQ
jgi:hypothetical protein